jgi:Holliday junction resolvase RusA-like endonuclease
LILDSLNGILWEDDRYIIEINSAKYYTTDQEKIEIKMQQTNISKYRKDYLETK